MIRVLFLTLLFLGCEFRPPNYQFEFDHENTKCFYPIAEVHYYNGDEAQITECEYDNKERVSQELVFSNDSLELSKLVIYNYFVTYYEKVIFDYKNGSKNNFYIVDKQYISIE